MPDSAGTVPTTYAYDPAGHLTSIGAAGHVTAFGIDALGRHASVAVDAGAVTAYTYLGTSNTVVAQAAGGNTVYSGIDAIGDRITTTEGGASVYVIPDLHGNVTATADTSSGPNYLTAYRYDPYGETCAAYLVGGLSTDTNPWRFQGRILQNAAGQTDLYDFGARSYDPSLGAFTSFDSVAGSAQNPLTLNRYLYANANPASMVDPDGHLACPDEVCNKQKLADQADAYRRSAAAQAAGCPVYYCGTTYEKQQDAEVSQTVHAAMQEQIKAYQAALAYEAAGCPIQYCGTAAQQFTYSQQESSMQAALGEQIAEQERQKARAAKVAHQQCDPNPFAGNSCFYEAAREFGRGFGDGVVNWPGDTWRGLTCTLDPNCLLKDPGAALSGLNPMSINRPFEIMQHALKGEWYELGYESGNEMTTAAVVLVTLGAGRAVAAIRNGMRGAPPTPKTPGVNVFEEPRYPPTQAWRDIYAETHITDTDPWVGGVADKRFKIAPITMSGKVRGAVTTGVLVGCLLTVCRPDD
jgi:RHS repeat-associated protein